MFIGATSYFQRSAAKSPDRPAIKVGGREYSYHELWRSAVHLANAINAETPPEDRFVGLLAYRSYTVFSGIVGIHASGRAYVPLNLKFPVQRVADILNISACRTVLVGKEFFPMLRELPALLKRPTLFISPEDEFPDDLVAEGHRLIGAAAFDAHASDEYRPVEVAPEWPAYLLFTSGSTGKPKGIGISQHNLCSFIELMMARYPLTDTDRCSQMFDTTFDASVQDWVLAWSNGACLCCASRAEMIFPVQFVRNNHITVWSSVPSTSAILKRMQQLKPGLFDEVRFVFFLGEALPVDIMKLYRSVAPGSRIINCYGPTEATVTIGDYEWSEGDTPLGRDGIATIGTVFANHLYKIVDDDLRDIPDGEVGELLLSGDQVSSGYFNDPDKTAQSFIRLPGADRVWYRTGDLVRRGADGMLYYFSRKDHQLKINGFRIEVQEVEEVIKKCCSTDLCVVLPGPPGSSVPQYLTALLATDRPCTAEEVLECCRARLPEYMVPHEVYFVKEFRYNLNGKLDRNALKEVYSELYRSQRNIAGGK